MMAATASTTITAPYDRRMGGSSSSSSTILKIAANSCVMNQHCMNDGTCVKVEDEDTETTTTDSNNSNNNNGSHRYCVCREGFSGPRCSRYCPLECLNGGYCTMKSTGGVLGIEDFDPTYIDSDYVCKCRGHFTGQNCEIPYQNCGNNIRCFHGGKCLLSTNVHTSGEGGDNNNNKKKNEDSEEIPVSIELPCQCQSGYTGPYCENEVSSEDTKEEEDVEGFKTISKGGRSTIIILIVCSIMMLIFLAVKRYRYYYTRKQVLSMEEWKVQGGQTYTRKLRDYRCPGSVRTRHGTWMTGGDLSYSDRDDQNLNAIELQIT